MILYNIITIFSYSKNFLVFFLLLILLCLVFVFYSLFFSNNILITYMACELFVILFLSFFLFYFPFWFLIKIQAFLLLIFGLIAAEMAIGLLLFVRFYRLSNSMVW